MEEELKDLEIVLDRLKLIAAKDRENLSTVQVSLESMLDYLHDEGVFGHEGENDPRGDFREDDGWSMWNVQDSDK